MTGSNKVGNRGFHPLLEKDHPYTFIDTCMQAWPDADYEVAHKHGVTAYGVTAWLPHATVDQALEGIMYWHLIARRYPNLSVATSADDIRNAKKAGGTVFFLAAQDGDFIANKLHRIEAFYRLGLRMMLPAYNASNLICDGCLDRTDSGLTRFGEMVVDECNRVGLLLDCTHIGRRASLDILLRSTKPVVFSHSNPKAMVDNPRNIDDEQIQACAATGGVVGLAPWGPLVLRKGQTQWPTVSDFVDLIDYVADLLGSTNNIGIGTDMSLGSYPGHTNNPWGESTSISSVMEEYTRYVTGDLRSPKQGLQGFSNYVEVLNVAEELAARNYSELDTQKILGLNYLRVFDAVWV